MAGLNHHRASIIQYSGHAMIKAVATERQSLVDRYSANSSFAASVNCLKSAQFKDAWCHLSSVFPNLALFAAGLSTVLPSTHTVEADFSMLKNLKCDSHPALSNYAMEGQLQAKQYDELEEAVASAKRAGAQSACRNVCH